MKCIGTKVELQDPQSYATSCRFFLHKCIRNKRQLTRLQSEGFAQFLCFSSSSFPLTAPLQGSRQECYSMHHDAVICGEDDDDNNSDDDSSFDDDNNGVDDSSFDDDNNGDDELMRRLKAASIVVKAGSPAAHVAGKHDDCGNRSKNDNDDCNEENDDDMTGTTRVR